MNTQLVIQAYYYIDNTVICFIFVVKKILLMVRCNEIN